MLLVLQIAGGIVLGWLVITHWDTILTYAKQILSVVSGFLLIAAIALGGKAAWDWAGINWHTVAYYALGGAALILMLISFAGTATLISRLPKFIDDKKEHLDFGGYVFGFVNVMVILGLLEAALDPIDVWSRAHGFDDLGTMFPVMLLANWPWLVLYALHKRKLRDDALEVAE